MCFEALGTSEFFVQSIDCHWPPLNEKTRIDLARQALEVFIEGEPSDRWGPYDSLQAAVAAFVPTMEAASKRVREIKREASGGAPDAIA